jgi:hypothetical protein
MKFRILALVTVLSAGCNGDPGQSPPPASSAGQTSGAGAGGRGGSGGGSAGVATAGTAGEVSAGAAGTSGSAGSGGAGSGGGGTGSDAGTGGQGGSADSCAAALLCDDFEGHLADAPPGAPWTVESNEHGEVVVMTGNAYSGQQALRVTTDGLDAYQRAYVAASGAPLFPAAQDVLWGRMMIYTEAAPNDGVHWTMIQGEGPVAGQSYRSLIRYGGQHQQRLMANYYTDDAVSDCWDHSDTEMPQGEWACMEWHYDAPNDTMRFYLDGLAVDDLTVVAAGEGCGGPNTWNFPEFDTALVGWESYQSDPAREIWIDDVALGTERISCP